MQGHGFLGTPGSPVAGTTVEVVPDQAPRRGGGIRVHGE